MDSIFILGGGEGSLGEHVANYYGMSHNVQIYDLKNGHDATGPEFSDTLYQDMMYYEPVMIINFVGEISYQKLYELEYLEFEKIWRINMLPLTNLAIALAQWVDQAAPESCVVQIGSNSSSYPFTGMYSYCVAKHAQKQAIKIMAKELAPYIRVNMVNPGPFTPETSDMSTRQIPLTLGDVDIDEGVDMMTQRIPMGRLCEVDDLIRSLEYLRKDSYMTGQVLELSGGQIL